MSATIVTHTDRLQNCKNRLQGLRAEQVRLRDYRDSARQAAHQNGGPVDPHSEEFMRLERAVSDLNKIESDIALTESEERFVLHQIAGLDGSGAVVSEENVLHDPSVLQNLASLAHSKYPVGNLNLGPVMSRGELISEIQRGQRMAVAGTVDVADTARQGAYYGITPQLRRPLTLLDVIPTSTMDAKSFDYTQESGTFDTALETVEGATKPQADVTLTDAQVVAKTVAHWTKLKKQQLADVPALQTMITTRLVYGVQRRVELQCLNGDGSGENIRGILQTSGVGAPASSAGDIATDMTLNGVIAVLQSFAQPDAVVVNPTDYGKMLKAKATGSGERMDSAGAFSVPANTLWGLPIVLNAAIAVGSALIGDFRLGATLFVRQGVTARLSDADQDDFTRNRITCLAEGRFGLAVWQPTAFAKVTLP